MEAIFLESASRDIVSRLAALDDDGKTNRSFPTLFSALKLKAFLHIAHVRTVDEVKPRVLDKPMDFGPAASMANNLLDDIEGLTFTYFFKLGSDDRIKLREKSGRPLIAPTSAETGRFLTGGFRATKLGKRTFTSDPLGGDERPYPSTFSGRLLPVGFKR